MTKHWHPFLNNINIFKQNQRKRTCIKKSLNWYRDTQLRLIALYQSQNGRIFTYNRIFCTHSSLLHQEFNYSSKTSSSSQDWLLNFLGENKLFLNEHFKELFLLITSSQRACVVFLQYEETPSRAWCSWRPQLLVHASCLVRLARWLKEFHPLNEK